MIEGALRELALDPLYDRLPADYRLGLAQAALQLGCEAAALYRLRPAAPLAASLGVTVERSEQESLVAGLIIRAESDAGARRIKLYMPALRQLAAGGRITAEQAEEVALAHELFHCLEDRLDLGRLPRYQLWRIGPWRRLVLPLRAREIAAHAFAMTVAGLDIYPADLDREA